jgi:hypothetical protein
VAAFKTILAKRTQAINERRPDLVSEIYSAGCGCFELKSIVEQATAAGQHHRGYEPVLLRVIELEGGLAIDNAADLRVITQQGTFTIVTDDGTVVGTEPGWAPQSSYWQLIRDSTGRWKVGDLVVEGPAEKVLGADWREAPE